MTATMTAPRFQTEARSTEEGPVLVAAKPLESGDAPLAAARWLARREDRELHVVSVLEHNDAMALAAGVPPLPAQFYEEERASIQARLRQQVMEGPNSYPASRVDVLEGPSARSIVEVAHDRGARVIVIGTGRHDSIGRFVYGERAMQILRLADRPVLVVPRDASPEGVRHAIVAVDFSAASLRAATAALPMIQRGGRLTLVNVRPAVNPMEPQAAARANSGEASCEESFKRFLKLLAPSPDLTVNTKVLWGDPVSALDEFARLWDVGLIASGRRRNHTLAERLFVGSVSSGLIRRASCLVLVVPEEDDSSAERTAGSLTGMASWDRGVWGERLAAFEARHRDQRVRLALETGSADHGGSITQGYHLRALRYDAAENELTIMVRDPAHRANTLNVSFGEMTSLVLFTDVDGRDLRLRFDSATAIGTITVAANELP